MASPIGIRRRLANAATMALVAGMSFLLLVYVGFGEANRSYEQFYVGKLTAQAKVLVNAIEGFLNRDLPLDQYVGFRPRAERLLSSDETIDAIALFDRNQRLIFSSGDPEIGLLPPDPSSLEKADGDKVAVRRDDTHLQILLPLYNDREIAGSIVISMSHALISRQIEARFLPLIPIVAGLSVGFAIFVGVFGGWLGRQNWPVLQTVYAGLFLLIAALVVGNLLSLYTKGTQIKTKALADSLGQRMTEVVGFNLDIAQIPGLDKAFSEYRRLNPEIAAAALVVDGQILIHTDSYMVGRPWESARGHYEYLVDISPRGSRQQVNIAVILPQEIVYWQTFRSVKNFAALFIASAFLASLFLQLAGSVNQRDGPQGRHPPGEPTRQTEEETLKLVKPVFYVTMCVEHLSYAFLASYIDGIVDASGLNAGLTSTVFTVYYLCFALTLIPAGHLAQQFSPKPLMIFGLFLTAASFLLLLNGSIGPLILARAIAGVGQAMLFIGVQSYILNVAAPGRKTRGAAIIVYGFQGGMISGMAIGSLLVSYIGPDGVFMVGAVATILTLSYAVALVPTIAHQRTDDSHGLKASVTTLGRHVLQAVGDRQLLKAIALVGIPAKAVLTGVVVFAIPLLMARQDYRQEDIGQLLMLYAAAVVLSNELIARWVDRTGDTRAVLVGGAVLSGASLGLIGLLGWEWFDEIPYGSVIEVVLVLIGVASLGAAHGLINAPIVSHVAALALSERIGVSALTATYRFLERIGHVAGPLVVGQIFLIAGEQAIVLAWIGLVIAVLGVLFFAFDRHRKAVAKDDRPDGTRLAEISDIVGLHLDRHHQVMVLAMRHTGTQQSADPAQSVLMQHLNDHGHALDPETLGCLPDDAASRPSDVSTVVVNRRRALRFKRFLADVAAAAPPDQQLLTIICSQHLRFCASDLAAWLERHAGSRLVAMERPEAWLDQMRGWLVLMQLDQYLGVERGGVDELLGALKDHIGGDTDDDLAWSGSLAGGEAAASERYQAWPAARADLRAVAR